MPPPEEPAPPGAQQSNLTDPDSALMRRSDAHEYRQAYNAQAVFSTDGTQLILATNLVASPSDAPSRSYSWRCCMRVLWRLDATRRRLGRTRR